MQLEAPLPTILVSRPVEGDDARETWIEVLRVALDGAAPGGRIPPLDEDDEFMSRLLRPDLALDQFHLNAGLLDFAGTTRDRVRMGIIRSFGVIEDALSASGGDPSVSATLRHGLRVDALAVVAARLRRRPRR